MIWLLSGVVISFACMFQCGYTPLHCADEGGYVDAMRLLIEAGARVDVGHEVSE